MGAVPISIGASFPESIMPGTMHAMYGVPADRARQAAIAGTPAQVASQLAP